MPGRLPTKNDFSPAVSLSITPPPPSQQPANVLILLHGLGDTNASFEPLGQQLSLPETACIAVQAPAALPFGLRGFHWGDDLVIDDNTGEMNVDTGFKASSKLILDEIIRKGLVGKCGYRPVEIMIFGFAQGGMVALQAAAELDGEELGGVISIGGSLSLSTPLKALEKKSKTPILVCKGSRRSALSDSAVSRLKDAFAFVEVQEWKKTGDDMPSNRGEMFPIMDFFSRRLRSMRGVPAGSVELT
ncbi:Phospholipase/carboxylesterase/thioesterase [Lophiotrema nucula]|uniref:Phospholipase/carboxylesterase/thioesterase n=1 Tax=Lophiotrema nucula TaxID=690887 RepID=A0A6A5Z2P1_9PLEO|nr:Phospholipase/carboxylesterase/thioesterase [Lophiotrema nucula]